MHNNSNNITLAIYQAHSTLESSGVYRHSFICYPDVPSVGLLAGSVVVPGVGCIILYVHMLGSSRIYMIVVKSLSSSNISVVKMYQLEQKC